LNGTKEDGETPEEKLAQEESERIAAEEKRRRTIWRYTRTDQRLTPIVKKTNGYIRGGGRRRADGIKEEDLVTDRYFSLTSCCAD
jgi:hypothetical protein